MKLFTARRWYWRDISSQQYAGNTTRTSTAHTDTIRISQLCQGRWNYWQSPTWLCLVSITLLTDTIQWQWQIQLYWERRGILSHEKCRKKWRESFSRTSLVYWSHQDIVSARWRSALRTLSGVADTSRWLANTTQKLRLAGLSNSWLCCQQRMWCGSRGTSSL